MKIAKISELTTNRLSIYLRCLNDLEANGQLTISSSEMARKYHLNSAQIRKDLANFGEFGRRGVGYDVRLLRDHLIKILGLDQTHRVCIVGSGRMGTALADYYNLASPCFKVAGLFDIDKKKIGKKTGGIEICDIKDFSAIVKRDKIEVAVIAVPAEHAQAVLDQVVEAGIKAVMNLAPVSLKADSNVKLKTVDLTRSLESLSYFLAGPTNSKKAKPSVRKRRK
ncbi:MAG TPA: redox-sensing transcriptional repressor Rex [Pyrinomonadaceae bacterium]|jgi:redox-sensing transcriptional repressor|nr:redox-sensing transcriptional repressor Rex [Pyrinomonadaceae bacterium]